MIASEDITFAILSPNDTFTIQKIARWYEQEWCIPTEITTRRFQNLNNNSDQFQLVMFYKGEPVGTGGIFHQCDILDLEPSFSHYHHWMSLVYTKPEVRGNGFGAQLCEHLTQYAKSLGVEDICLFTETAEKLYQKLHWKSIEHLHFGTKTIAVMTKHLS